MSNLSSRASSLSSYIERDNVYSKFYLLSFRSSFKSGSSGTNAFNAYISLAFLCSVAFCASFVPLLASLFKAAEFEELVETGLELFGVVF